MHHRNVSSLLCALSLVPVTAPLRAQADLRGDGAARRAAESIVAAEVRDRIAVLADDSMLGRATPSPQLDRVAAYIAAQFRSFGLAPAGDSGSFIQRYAIRLLRQDTTSFLMAMGRGAHGHWPLGRDAMLAFGEPPAQPVTGPIVLVAGRPADTARPFGDVPLEGTIVIQVARREQLDRSLLAVIAKGAARGVRAWITVTDLPGAAFAQLARSSVEPQYQIASPSGRGSVPISVYLVRDSAAMEVLRAGGEDVAALLALGAAPGVRALPGFTATVDVRRTVISEASAPNTIAVLEGSDPRLRHEYVFFTGHMDHIGVPGSDEGCRPVGADSICNGADDGASGAVGVVELAQAFSRMAPRPRRSLVFMTVSGKERGLWGSGYYVSHPSFPLAATVADFNADMIGRKEGDGVMAIGMQQSSLGPLADSVAARHPELRLRVIGDTMPQEHLFYRSDHFNFARNGVPILFFTTGLHPDYRRPTDSVDKIDAEQEARILRLVFYLGLDVANAAARPEWNPESRREIVEGAGAP
jgi:hypothetical protein